MKDFEIMEEIGHGAYGEVYLVKRSHEHKHHDFNHSDNEHKYRALKFINRRTLQREKKQHHVIIERTILSHFSHQCLIK